MTLPESARDLPQQVKDSLLGIKWHYNPDEHEKRSRYLSKLFDDVADGKRLSLEDSGRLIMNALALQRENSELRQKIDDVVVELIKTRVDRFPFRC